MKKLLIIFLFYSFSITAHSATPLSASDIHSFLGLNCEIFLAKESRAPVGEDGFHDDLYGPYIPTPVTENDRSPMYQDEDYGVNVPNGGYEGPMYIGSSEERPVGKDGFYNNLYEPYIPQPVRDNDRSPVYSDEDTSTNTPNGGYEGPMYIGSSQDLPVNSWRNVDGARQPLPLHIEVPQDIAPRNTSVNSTGRSAGRGVYQSEIGGEDYNSSNLNNSNGFDI